MCQVPTTGPSFDGNSISIPTREGCQTRKTFIHLGIFTASRHLRLFALREILITTGPIRHVPSRIVPSCRQFDAMIPTFLALRFRQIKSFIRFLNGLATMVGMKTEFVLSFSSRFRSLYRS